MPHLEPNSQIPLQEQKHFQWKFDPRTTAPKHTPHFENGPVNNLSRNILEQGQIEHTYITRFDVPRPIKPEVL